VKQNEVREEVAMIVKAIKESDAQVPSFLDGMRPSLTYLCLVHLMMIAGVVPVLLFENDVDITFLVGMAIGSIIFNMALGTLIYAYYVQYLIIPKETRERSRLLALIRGKVSRYIYFHFGVLLTVSAFGLASGGAAALPFVQIPLFFITGFILLFDLGRYNLPSLAGLVDAAKDEFKNNELQEFLNGVNKEKK
jgi:phage shock protein PspC (stress-responsive transcriptional regulator)